MITLRLRDYLAGERLQRDTRRYLRRLRELPVLRSRETTSALLRWLAARSARSTRAFGYDRVGRNGVRAAP